MDYTDRLMKENLAMKIMNLRDMQEKGEISFEDALRKAVKLIEEYGELVECVGRCYR